MGSGYYPTGSEYDPNAPWNQVDNPDREIEVTVSVTLSKTIKVTVNDYTMMKEIDEDGVYIDEDFSECDLKSAVKEQYVLPYEAAPYVNNDKVKKQLEDWNIDDFEVILE